MVYGSVFNFVISVAISESFILGGIGGCWYETWEVRGLCFLEVDDGRLYFYFCGTCL